MARLVGTVHTWQQDGHECHMEMTQCRNRRYVVHIYCDGEHIRDAVGVIDLRDAYEHGHRLVREHLQGETVDLGGDDIGDPGTIGG